MVKQQLKNLASLNGTMLKMNNNTYDLRRKVMNVLYEIKKNGYNIPRVEIRILSEETDACAYAYTGKNIVHVNKEYISDKYEYLFTQIILHEIVHAVFGIGQVKGCKLMHCEKFWDNKPTKEIAWKLFAKYYKNYKK